MRSEKLAEEIYEKLKIGNVSLLIKEINEKLDSEKTEKLRFTKTPFLNAIGVALGKLLVKDKQKFQELTDLWKKGDRDVKLIVISALGRISREEYEGSKQFILGVTGDIANWEICDQLALKVIANLALQNQKEIFSLMEEWLKSGIKWEKRLAVATIPPYVRAKPVDAKICLSFLNNAMKEQDKDVRKAVGWALREISKKDPEATFLFLQKWAERGDKYMARIVKEGMKKLPKNEQEKLRLILVRKD